VIRGAVPRRARAPIPPGALAGRDPAAIPHHVDRYQKRRGWSSALGFCPFCDGPEEQTDPLRVRVPITLEDETLLVTLDEDLEVREARRA